MKSEIEAEVERPRAGNCRSGGVTSVLPRRYSLGQRDGVSLMSAEQYTIRTSNRSFLQQLRDGKAAVPKSLPQDPWLAALSKLKGRIGHDGVERIATNDVFDALEVPMRRRPSETIRLSRLMRSLGWQNIRARGLNPGSYRDRVRGYAREVPGHPATVQAPNDF
jgi:hypothetical protein